MKVQITIEIDDSERLGIGAVNGAFRPATREECREWIATTLEKPLAVLGVATEDARADLIETLKL
jgi:hypothetical protein